jgi:hypothetical protein
LASAIVYQRRFLPSGPYNRHRPQENARHRLTASGVRQTRMKSKVSREW